MSLNENQKLAASTYDGPVLILAGAGSGKTRTLTHRIASLIENKKAEPYEILAITFTNKAANELKERISSLLDDNVAKKVFASTFHSLSARIIRESGTEIDIPKYFTILDTSDSVSIIKKILKEYYPEDDLNANNIQKTISYHKNHNLTEIEDLKINDIWEKYQVELKVSDSLDFDDLLLKSLEILKLKTTKWNTRFKYILVDEYQDTNGVQYQLLRLLCHNNNLCVVGDDDQCLVADTKIDILSNNIIDLNDRLNNKSNINIKDNQTKNNKNQLNISEIKQGDYIKTWTGQKFDFLPVNKVMKSKVNRITKITLENDISLEITANHILFTKKEDYINEELSLILAYNDKHVLLDNKTNEILYESLDLEELSWKTIKLATSKKLNYRSYLNFNSNLLLMKQARELTIGDYLYTINGFQQIKDIQQLDKKVDIYDLNIKPYHNFIANTILSHNSIYSFRGAQIEHILAFEKDWPNVKVFKLEENYRSKPEIINLANSLIKNNINRNDKTLKPVRTEKAEINALNFEKDYDESEYIAKYFKKQNIENDVDWGDMTVIYRNNSQSKLLEEAFFAANIPYKVIGSVEFYKRAEIKDARTYIQFFLNPTDLIAFSRLVNTPKRGIGSASLNNLIKYCKENNKSPITFKEYDLLSSKAANGLKAIQNVYRELYKEIEELTFSELALKLYQNLGLIKYYKELGEKNATDEARLENIYLYIAQMEKYNNLEFPNSIINFLEETALVEAHNQDDVKNAVSLMTFHATKGLEFKEVWLSGLEDDLFLKYDDNNFHIEEARRLLYVGITRSQDNLSMSYCNNRFRFTGNFSMNPVRFLNELNLDFQYIPSYSEKKKFSNINSVTSFNNKMTIKSKAVIENLENEKIMYGAGSQVFHSKFGVGKVISEDNKQIKIAFSIGVKTLLKKFVELKKL